MIHGVKQDPVSLCEVIKRRQLSPQSVQLTLLAPQIALAARPGQFVNLDAGYFLRRPIGIMSVDRDKGLLSLGIRIQGKGSAELAALQPGQTVSVLGPLGHGFDFKHYKRIITVGGGTGVFPLYFVQQACREQGLDSLAVCGYRSRQDSVLTDEYRSAGCQVLFASDEGDMDVPGHAAKALEQLLKTLPPQPDTAIFTCGPKVMMQSVARLAADYKLACQVSLEERMACGVGVCLVCVCKTEQHGQQQQRRCCVDGPVFMAEEVVWS